MIHTHLALVFLSLSLSDIVHRDLKLENILVKSCHQGNDNEMVNIKVREKLTRRHVVRHSNATGPLDALCCLVLSSSSFTKPFNCFLNTVSLHQTSCLTPFISHSQRKWIASGFSETNYQPGHSMEQNRALTGADWSRYLERRVESGQRCVINQSRAGPKDSAVLALY